MDRIVFYFDFSSPYAYAALPATVALAQEAGLVLEMRPVMVWAILQAQGIAPPLDTPARHAYMMQDMARTAAFHGLPYAPPLPLPVSAHRASRMWLGLTAAGNGVALARAIYAARFAAGHDIRDTDVLVEVATAAGYGRAEALAAMDGDGPKAALKQSVDAALVDGAVGVPFFVWGTERFFGADRLPQLRWRLGLTG